MEKQTFNARYMHNYRRANPERQKQWRINSAVRLLENNGYKVTKIATSRETEPAIKRKTKRPEDMSLEELQEKIALDREKQIAYCRKWQQKNREHVRAYHKEWTRKNKQRIQQALEQKRQEQQRKGVSSNDK